MSPFTPYLIGLFIFLVMLLPAVFLIYAAITLSKKITMQAVKLLVIGAVLLAFASLDTTFNYFSAFFIDSESITDVIVYSSVLFEGINIIALITLSFGLIKLSKIIATP